MQRDASNGWKTTNDPQTHMGLGRSHHPPAPPGQPNPPGPLRMPALQRHTHRQHQAAHAQTIADWLNAATGAVVFDPAEITKWQEGPARHAYRIGPWKIDKD